MRMEVKIRGPDQGPGPIPEDNEFVSTFGVNDTNIRNSKIRVKLLRSG